ncbi:hypothetical protein [Streptomyces sp. TS71-3]|uniref:hypothetical protein n=1 Tax=Streptomyces sp. TS71-3 TaxID=2733862 RepID=UPI001B203619|nr:hypothetical protein [Streptomyces sp. TS71-3]GHJ41007.1 hypothetical protein Sm713_66160 [Streptomyces sp. TS71-3]
MTERPTPDEAARSLHDVGIRRDQTFDSVHDARWVEVFFGVAIFLLVAAPDFFGSGSAIWTSWGIAALAVAYAVLLRTRRGSAFLGRPTRLRGDQISPRFTRYHRLVILAVMVIGLVGAFIPHGNLSVPYLRTAIGAVLGLVLILFGRRIQRSLLAAARPGTADDPGAGRAAK